MKPIFLCGFMGCGKSTVGKLLAKKLDIPFIDTDTFIEQHVGLPIPNIFKTKGEAYFREKEFQCCKMLSNLENCVIATGGGMLTAPRCWNEVKDRALVVYLHPSFNVCYQRIKDTSRPLVAKNSKEELADLYHKRHLLYTAHSHITLDNPQSPGETVENILPFIHNEK